MVAVLDLTAGPGCFAMAAIRAGIPYCGVCFTDEHVKQLYSRLISLVAACIQDEGSSLYNPRYSRKQAGDNADNLVDEEGDVNDDKKAKAQQDDNPGTRRRGNGPGGGGRGRGRPGPKPQPKPKPRSRVKAIAGDEEQRGPDQVVDDVEGEDQEDLQEEEEEEEDAADRLIAGGDDDIDCL